MNLAVAVNAEGEAVRNVETALNVVGPMLNVVGLNRCCCPAVLAAPPVTGEDCFSPLTQGWRYPGAFIPERLAALPVARRCANHPECLAGPRAVDSPVRITLESDTADGAIKPRGTVTPASLTAPSRRDAVGVDFEASAALLADPLEFRLGGYHVNSIPRPEPRYVAVAVRRWEEFTGRKAERE